MFLWVPRVGEQWQTLLGMGDVVMLCPGLLEGFFVPLPSCWASFQVMHELFVPCKGLQWAAFWLMFHFSGCITPSPGHTNTQEEGQVLSTIPPWAAPTGISLLWPQKLSLFDQKIITSLKTTTSLLKFRHEVLHVNRALQGHLMLWADHVSLPTLSHLKFLMA